MSIAIPVILVVIVGLLASCMLSYASKVFAIQEDQLFLDLRAELPGANCGGCGFAGCDDYAHALVENSEIPCTKCSVGGPAVAKKLAALMGQEAGEMEKKVAFVMCNGTTENAEQLYQYEDIDSCKAAKQLYGGSKVCPFGCIGLGDCVEACNFDAIRIMNGVAVVGRDYCTSCGACAKACPQKLIKIIPESSKVQVRCHNEQKGADARKVCKTSCIGCGMCARVCPKGAISVENNLSRIDPEKSCTLPSSLTKSRRLSLPRKPRKQRRENRLRWKQLLLRRLPLRRLLLRRLLLRTLDPASVPELGKLEKSADTIWVSADFFMALYVGLLGGSNLLDMALP